MKYGKKKAACFGWVVIGTAALSIIWWLYLKPGSGRVEIKKIILISIDTCRADHLSCYGFNKQTTPHIDRIASEGILFENVVSPVPITLPAHTSMLTGQIPPAHGIHDNANYSLTEEKLTLAELLKNNGFATAGIVSAFVLDAQFGINQGFESYNDDFKKTVNTVSGLERRGDETTDIALDWLPAHKDGKFFLFLHFYDPHYPYDPPEPFASRYADDAYSGEIAFTDFCIGRVIDRLKELEIYDSTLLIITGDHGEMLGEHGEEEHMYFIYEPAVKVPLIVKLPGKGNSGRENRPVGLIDIVPTVCGLLGIKNPGSVQGTTLEPCLRAQEPCQKERFFYIESMMPTYLGANPLLGITTGEWKYIRTTRPELYDLRNDPQENSNLFLKQRKQARNYDAALQDILQRHKFTIASVKPAGLQSETINRLASLGYMAAEISADSFSINRGKPDPKDLVELHALLQRVQELKFTGRYSEAKQILEEHVIRESHFKLYEQLGEINMREENLGLAAEYYSRALELNKKNYHANLNLGFIMIKTGKPQQAIEYFKQALSTRPQNIDALRNLGIVYENTGEPAEACRYLEKVLELNPRDTTALNHLGMVKLQQGEEWEAQQYFNKSVTYKPAQPFVLAQLSQVKTINRDSTCYDPAGAISLALEACRLTNFKEPRLLFILATAYARSGQAGEAKKTAQQALRLAVEAGDRILAQQIEKQIRFLKQK